MNTDFYPQKVFRYCPRCGSQQFEPYGNKANKCKDCDFVFYFNAATAVAVIIRDEKGRVLLTRRAFNPGQGMLDLPGGFVDPLESAESAVDREIAEELNLQITSKKYLGSFPNTYLYGGVVYFTTDLVFECSVSSFDAIMAKDDVASCEFYSITEEIIAQVSASSIQQILRQFCL